MFKVVKKSVTLSRALKEKNRWAGRLAELRERISSNNSHEESALICSDVAADLADAKDASERLVAIKTAIAEANAEIVGLIIQLEELKGELAWLKGLETKEGVFKSQIYHDVVEEKFVVGISGSEKIKMIDELQRKANKIQDALDDFNGTHRVSIEVDED